MYDTGKVILGIVVALVLVTFPWWYNAASDAATTIPDLDAASDTIADSICVRDTAWMRGHHMDLLNDWRDEVVRENERYFRWPGDEQREKSLSNTCLGCHVNKEKFCDRCHTFMGVEPYCWDCHIIPKEVM